MKVKALKLVSGGLLLSLMTGCVAPLLIGGAAVGGAAMVATDRRTSGTILDDQSIELKANNRVRELLGDKQHVNVTSYNRSLLLTGEVHTDADKASVEQSVGKIEGVKGVTNELVVGWPSSLSDRTADTTLKVKVKATLVDAKEVPANAFDIVVERKVVYLMGRVTEAEATRAVDLTRTISGVQKVVRMTETITEAEVLESKPR